MNRFCSSAGLRAHSPEIDMGRSSKILLLGSILSLLACGGSDSGSGSDLTATEINSISHALVGAMNSSSSGSTGSSLVNVGGAGASEAKALTFTYTPTCSQTAFQLTASANGSYGCAGGGHISYTGNFKTSCASTYTYYPDYGVCNGCTSWYTSNAMTFQVSDPTNNLNDCDVGDGVILDGTLYLTAVGTDAAIDISLTGTLGIDRRGNTGGLTPIASDCFIFIKYTAATGKTTGSICGYPISS
jgi:hypothetical protein